MEAATLKRSYVKGDAEVILKLINDLSTSYYCRASDGWLAKRTGMSLRTTQRIIQRLKKDGKVKSQSVRYYNGIRWLSRRFMVPATKEASNLSLTPAEVRSYNPKCPPKWTDHKDVEGCSSPGVTNHKSHLTADEKIYWMDPEIKAMVDAAQKLTTKAEKRDAASRATATREPTTPTFSYKPAKVVPPAETADKPWYTDDKWAHLSASDIAGIEQTWYEMERANCVVNIGAMDFSGRGNKAMSQPVSKPVPTPPPPPVVAHNSPEPSIQDQFAALRKRAAELLGPQKPLAPFTTAKGRSLPRDLDFGRWADIQWQYQSDLEEDLNLSDDQWAEMLRMCVRDYNLLQAQYGGELCKWSDSTPVEIDVSQWNLD